ncbi:hypothetical protein [Herbiconiux sp. VKM Ac-2851]|uniref:hypothetical protein n=1 Tax=Herbiconiux sp. VKM Ac-2851 TaxID=2739025 RepID=UPI0015630451|nr:hypothetical protein [Herbiconiux sp. VKM Ac-2851]NQX34043.1 hypothetical protein [Herbiconiux sp. VKM Ac-2851]
MFIVNTFTETLRPLVAIYEVGGKHQAHAIIGLAAYRDMAPEARGTVNPLVPILQDDLTTLQTHAYKAYADIPLPEYVVQDADLYGQLEFGWAWVVEDATGAWVVSA